MTLVATLNNRKKRILVVVPHFFNTGHHRPLLFGSYETENSEVRKTLLERSKFALETELNNADLDFEIYYLGIENSSLMELQIVVSPLDPRFLPWLAMDFAFSECENYDFVLVIEDDIEVESHTIPMLLAFNQFSEPKDTLIPNRIEFFDGFRYCTDLVAMPGWKGPKFTLAGLMVREPINIHSGFLFLRNDQYLQAYVDRPFKSPTLIIGDFMASAFANMHSNFRILRSLPVTGSVTVLHHDNWAQRLIDNGRVSQDEMKLRIRASILH
jgi:hypothetical protein